MRLKYSPEMLKAVGTATAVVGHKLQLLHKRSLESLVGRKGTRITRLKRNRFSAHGIYAVKESKFKTFGKNDLAVLKTHVAFAEDLDLIATVHTVAVAVFGRNTDLLKSRTDYVVVVQSGQARSQRTRVGNSPP